jgi:hypothetical protein
LTELLLPVVFALLAVLVTLENWRRGLLLAVLVGFAQDPLRKIAPGEPVFFVILALAVAVFAGAVAWLRLGGFRLDRMLQGDRLLRDAVSVMLWIVAMQAVHAFARFGSPVLVGIGAMSYLAPLGALWFAYQYARRAEDVRRLLQVHVVCALVLAGTVFLSYQGVESPLFREVGSGVQIYERTLGLYIEAHVGIMRASEVAAWHLGAATCFVLILAFSSRRPVAIQVAIIVAGVLIAAGLLTGRRKMLAMIAGFGVLYLLLIWNSRHRSTRNTILTALSAPLLLFGGLLLIGVDPVQQGPLANYWHRGGTVWEDAYDRFMNLGVRSVQWAWHRAGFFGLGVGAGSQGAQHFGGMTAGGAAEAGLGKIMSELGVPGLVVVLFVIWAFARHFWRNLQLLQRMSSRLSLLLFGLVAFLAANFAVFTTAAQIYGDPFVLLILGSCGGFVLAAPRLLYSEQVLRQGKIARRQQAGSIAAAAVSPGVAVDAGGPVR